MERNGVVGRIENGLRNVSAKRGRTAASGTESWYPYYAGYTESFVRCVLTSSCLRRGTTVLDPWNGCGTTTYVSNRSGYRAVGIDLNPVANIVASAKLVERGEAARAVENVRRSAPSIVERRHNGVTKDPLARWLCKDLVDSYRAIERHVLSNLGGETAAQRPRFDTPSPLTSFLLLVLMRSARTFSNTRPTSNPTWVRPDERVENFDPRSLARVWVSVLEKMVDDVHDRTGDVPEGSAEVVLGDCRNMNVADGTVDLVLSSPPYCTRVDYVIGTSFELAALGVSKDEAWFDRLRRTSMGTPMARKVVATPLDGTPSKVRELLDSIRDHPSKSSSGYYHKTYVQYFNDVLLSLKEIRRVLKRDGIAVFVLQNSYYKNLHVDLTSLYRLTAESIGAESCVVPGTELRSFLTQMNSRSNSYRGTTRYSEDVLLLRFEGTVEKGTR